MTDQDPSQQESQQDQDDSVTSGSINREEMSANSMMGGTESSVSTNLDSTPLAVLPTPMRGLGWFLVFALVYLVGTLIYVMGYGIYMGATMSMAGDAAPDVTAITELLEAHVTSPNGLTGVYIVQFIVLVPTIIVASSFNIQSWRETLAFNPVSQKQLMFWAGMWLVYQIVFMILSAFVDVETDDFVTQMQGSKHIGMFFTVVVLAPIMEELVFRGYLFKVMRPTWLGFYGTLIITSVLFGMLHLGQYGWWALSQVFVLALLLGVAREKTGSLYTSILIHGLNNLLAAVFIIFLGLA